MNHKVNSVANLHVDGVNLYKNLVVGTADFSSATIIKNLDLGIEGLKKSWEGKDAGVQINNIVTVYNAMIGIRNALALLACETTKIASDYRDIQNSNGAGLETLTRIQSDMLSTMAEYSDNRDMVNITQEAVNGKQKIDAANNAITTFVSEVKKSFDNIMNNWTLGPGRQEAVSSFEHFVSHSKDYINLLSEASQSIATALKNYGL